jgi:hypothetical protein
LVPHDVPFVALVPRSVHVCVAQAKLPLWQALAGVHAAPFVQPVQPPFSQTPVPPSVVLHAVPLGSLPEVTQVEAPVVHEVTPDWQAAVGVHVLPAVHAAQVPLSQTSFVPHDVPLATSVSVSTQVGAPEEQLMEPTWHAFEGVHELPVVHAPQDPLSQTSFVPHDVPLATLVSVSTHADVPDAQDVVPAWHGFVGVHEVPAVHAEHAPLSQTLFVPQDVPFAAVLPVSLQTGKPDVQTVVPTSHAFVGVHAAPGVHPPHAPALQNSLVPQAVPLVAAVPVSVQVAVPDAHDVSPTSHGFAGVHAVPAVHAPHAPSSHTSFVPHDVPFATVVPVSLQTGEPVVHDVVPVWHAFDGVHGAPVEHVMQVPLLQTSGVPASLGPHVVPFSTFAPVSLQTGTPDEQTTVPTWHAFDDGVHAAPAVQVPHAPLSQTSPAPHDVPLVAFVF